MAEAIVIRTTLVGGDVAKGSSEFSPPPSPMTLGSRWVLVDEKTFTLMHEALRGWDEYGDAALSEFSFEPFETRTCDEGLCPKCQEAGCIADKREDTKRALTAIANATPA